MKQPLGWAQYQVRGDRAIRRHWQLVCCAFSFCWWAASACRTPPEAVGRAGNEECDAPATEPEAGRGGKGAARIAAPAGLMAVGVTQRAGMAGTVDTAGTLLAGLERSGPRRPRCGGYLTGSGTDTRLTAMPADNKLPLALSIRSDLKTRLDAFDQGINDIITLPFAPEELLARLLVITHRTYDMAWAAMSRLTLDNLKVELLRRRVRIGASELHLTALGLGVLYLLSANAGRTLTRNKMLDAVWDSDYIGKTKIVDRHIHDLSMKLQYDSNVSCSVVT